MTSKRSIDRADILDVAAYRSQRKQRRAEMMAVKERRRMAVGPNATLYFESYATMLYQIQEMLNAEGGGPAQLEDEIAAYDPLVPKGDELVATFMLEYPDPVMRARALARLGGIEETVSLVVEGETVPAAWETEVDRTTAEGKTSALHFLHFRLGPALADRFRRPGARVMVSVAHPAYGHMAVMPEATRAELAGDL
ncbi:DUF3501 family protein [Magnetospirillum sp. UT-4]|uniref:DUF3501 family protein n=1 Tax=Magnetospirillum sp. UT-4 TaxID=2681467 RepID=UPI00137E3E1C|nr:DUF3501 family protein [Magnetospirillum sp. UT-4]CAA7627070.1 conserved hypothetical protein [Magnetospirillum sp. UT-4]